MDLKRGNGEREFFCEKLSKDVTENNQPGFWHKVEFGMRPYTTRAALRIGEARTEKEILHLWRQHFGNIVNSEAPANVEKERLLLEETLRTKMKNSKLPWWCVQVQPYEVEDAIKN